VNVRSIAPGQVPAPGALTADLSFISLAKALPAALALARPGAWLVALVKPQFEVGRAAVGKGGIVRDEAAIARARRAVAAFLAGEGWRVTGETESPILGGDGNREYLVAAEKPASRRGATAA
jgi:23S rRNA (cytidine1920-2'-O)/16S rRNA (cytidine1409-2'-O)-methyltransferase